MPEIGTFAELITYPHPYLPLLPATEWRWGWRDGDGVVAHFCGDRNFVIALGGDRLLVADLLHRSVEFAPIARITLQRPHADLLAEDRSDWDWMSIYRDDLRILPVRETEELGIEHNQEIATFLSTASPTASTQPGSADIITWHAIRQSGRLVAVGAASRWKSGAAVLVSIATDPEFRGQGLATDITASLTDSLFKQGEPRVTLGLFAGNESALHAYQRVGFTLSERFTSGSRNTD